MCASVGWNENDHINAHGCVCNFPRHSQLPKTYLYGKTIAFVFLKIRWLWVEILRKSKNVLRISYAIEETASNSVSVVPTVKGGEQKNWKIRPCLTIPSFHCCSNALSLPFPLIISFQSILFLRYRTPINPKFLYCFWGIFGGVTWKLWCALFSA